MDLSFLNQYINPIILGICLCVGYALKEAFPKFDNQKIPLVMLVLGCALNIIANIKGGITLEVVFGGMISGLGSTGCYELLRNFIGNKNNKKG